MGTSERVKFNLVGNTFTHSDNGNLGYSVHGKVSKHVEWVFDGSGEATVFMDNVLGQVNEVPWDGPKYGWLLESKYITPAIVEAVKNEWQAYTDAYDMIFTHNQELLALSPKFKWVPAQGFWVQEPKVYPKIKWMSMICSNKADTEGHRFRLDYRRKADSLGMWAGTIYQDLPYVEIWGRGFNEIANKEQALRMYRYSIAIENGFYETYFTEKLLDCFATGTIPVYKGAPDLGNYFNMDGVIDLPDKAIDLRKFDEDYYNDRIDAIKDNFERVRQYEILEDFIWDRYLKDRHG